VCGVYEDQFAALKLFKDAKSARGKSRGKEILFCNVGHIICKAEERKVTLKSPDGNNLLSFCATSDAEQEQWIKFCKMLCDLPYYFIPIQPNYCLVPQNVIARLNDSSEFDPGMSLKLYSSINIFDLEYTWIVSIIHKDTRLNIDQGLYVAADCGSTFRLYDCSNQNTLVYSWNSNNLKYFGYSQSLVFIAVTGGNNAETGLLWMDCTQPSKICECLEKLVEHLK